MISHKFIDDQIAVGAVFNGKTKMEFIGDPDRSLDIIRLVCMDLDTHTSRPALKNAYENRMENQGPLRVPDSFYSIPSLRKSCSLIMAALIILVFGAMFLLP